MTSIRIGFDIGGVLSKYPEAIAFYRACLASPLMDVHIVTDMPKDKALAMLRLNGIDLDPAYVHGCDYAEHGEERKAEKAKEIGLDVLIDDFIGYVATPGGPALRLLTMPDPTRDYYHPDWKTDGNECDFGRRKKPRKAAVAEKMPTDRPMPTSTTEMAGREIVVCDNSAGHCRKLVWNGSEWAARPDAVSCDEGARIAEEALVSLGCRPDKVRAILDNARTEMLEHPIDGVRAILRTYVLGSDVIPAPPVAPGPHRMLTRAQSVERLRKIIPPLSEGEIDDALNSPRETIRDSSDEKNVAPEYREMHRFALAVLHAYMRGLDYVRGPDATKTECCLRHRTNGPRGGSCGSLAYDGIDATAEAYTYDDAEERLRDAGYSHEDARDLLDPVTARERIKDPPSGPNVRETPILRAYVRGLDSVRPATDVTTESRTNTVNLVSDEILWAADQLRPYGKRGCVEFGGVGSAIRSLLSAVDSAVRHLIPESRAFAFGTDGPLPSYGDALAAMARFEAVEDAIPEKYSGFEPHHAIAAMVTEIARMKARLEDVGANSEVAGADVAGDHAPASDARAMNRMSEAQIRVVASVLGSGVKVVRGKFVVNTDSAAVLAGRCRGDALTDSPDGCEAIAATIIVIPHVGVRLPAGTSVDRFMANPDSFFAGEDVKKALSRLESSET